MGFLAPGAFLAGAGLALAILATYLLRPRRPTRRVSSTLLWLAALHDVQAQRPWRRVPPSLLLLVQLATLAALVAALARPYVLSAASTGAYSIVLLDASASMQATDTAPSRFEAARARAAQLIDALEPGQRLALVSLDAQPRVVAPPSDDRAQLHRALASLQPGTQSANLPAGLSVAASLAEGHADAQVTVIADGSLDRSQIPAAFSIPVRSVAIGTPDAQNVSIAGLGTREAGGSLTSALAHVVNTGSRAQDVTVALRVDGTRFDARSLSLGPGGAADAEWDDLPASAGVLEARLEDLSPGQDSLALDNAAWAVRGGDRPTRVLLVSDGNVFVERALGLRPNTSISRISPSDYPSALPADQAFDLVVLDGFVPPPATLPTGSSVLLLHPPADNGFVGVGPDLPVSGISAARPDDALLADVPLDGIHISRSRRLDRPGWADVVLSAPETPLLLVGDQAGRRAGVLGFDVHDSDLPLQPGFPVLMQHLLDWLVPSSSTATPVVQVGQSISLSALPETVGVDVVAPDGRRSPVAPPLPPPAFSGTDQPGVYQVVQRDAAGRETTSNFAVNFFNATESQLRPGVESGAPPVGPRREPLQAPQEVWEALVVVALALLVVELALAWWQFAAPGPRARLALGMRVLLAGLLIGALVGVAVPQPVDRQATVFVADVSSSVLAAQPEVASFVNQAVAARRADDAYAVVATGGTASVVQPLTLGASADAAGQPAVAPSPIDQPQDATDLAAGLRLAGDLLPAGYRSRVVLLSDGQETSGDAVAQARALQARGVQVDVVALPTASGPEALVDSVSAPGVVHEGERFNVGVRLVSNVPDTGTLRVFVNDQPIAEQAVTLARGTTDLSFPAQAAQAGLLDVRATLAADQDTLAQNNAARAVVEVQGPPRVLLVEQRPGEGDVIAAALTSTGVRLDTRPVADLPDQIDVLGGYAAVVLADVAAPSLTTSQQASLRSYVRDLGRGLLAIGGDTSFGQGDYLGTPLDEVLPVHSSVRSHRDQGRVALLLVLDRSGSMADDVYHEGTTKLDMAVQAASLSAQQLAPRDLVGILAFDSSEHWVMPMASVLGLGPTTIQDALASLQADGGTNVFPALSAAFDAIKATDARYKHLILLTDGQSCCGGDYPALQDRMRAANVTLSTIAIGADADQQLLSQLARQGDGRYAFAEHARDIPRLMTRETQLATRGPLVEGPITPRQVGPDPTLTSLSASGLPELDGYLVTTPKDLAQVLLVSDAADPLLARWQYGLGRAVAWTSDLRGRWSTAWVDWPGTAQVFGEQIDWAIAPARGSLRMTLRADARLGYVTVDDAEPGQTPGTVHVNVAQPGGEPLELDLAPTGPGSYAGSFPLAGAGTYLVRAQEQRDGAPVASAEAGLPVNYPAEFRQVSADPQRLDQIARAGGGHLLSLSTPRAAFSSDDLAPLTTPLPLQRVLLALAAVLLVIEVGLRRLRVSPGDLGAWLRHPRPIAWSLPTWSAELPIQPPVWLPGMRTARQVPAPLRGPQTSEATLGSRATPSLARASAADLSPADADDGEDALGATLKWLAARRGNRADPG